MLFIAHRRATANCPYDAMTTMIGIAGCVDPGVPH
jgi:hypothetical protein